MDILSSLLPSSLSPLPPPPFEPPSPIHHLLHSPISFLLHHLHHLLSSLLPPPPPHPHHPIRILTISDTHSLHPSAPLPAADILIHAGDLTSAGTPSQLQTYIDHLSRLPYAHIIIIAGNHDSFLDPTTHPYMLPPQPASQSPLNTLNLSRIHYLARSSITLTFPGKGHRKLTIYGDPHIPACGGRDFAFQYPRGQDNWSGSVPMETDVLVTHTPIKWHGDLAIQALGDEWLLAECWRVRPRLVVCGHVHAGAGREIVAWDMGQRGFEELAGRRGKGVLGDMLDLSAWVGVGRVVYEDWKTLVRMWVGMSFWGRRGGGQNKGDGRDGETTSWVINAALMYRNTGRLGNTPQVVVL